jgi:hypothetical protein
MTTIFADFNAITDAGQVRLKSRASRDDLQDSGARPGDWTWLSDGELVVGARLAGDEREGILAVPDWGTLVQLDDESERDPVMLTTELRHLFEKPERGPEDEMRIFRLMMLFERTAPPIWKSGVRPGYFASRRAGSLLLLDRPELALLEIEAARRLDPGHVEDDRLFLEILRRLDLDRATREAEARAAQPDAPASLLAGCVNVLATHADKQPDERFRTISPRILEWAERFEHAPGREYVRAATLAQLQINRGLVLLRSGDVEAARRAFALARATDPIIPEIEQAARLTTYDQCARDLADRVRSRPAA